MRARNACKLAKFNVLGVNAGISVIDESPRAPFGARSIYVQRRADFRVLPPCHGGWEIFQRQQQPRRKEGFKEIERRWMSMAQNCRCNSEEAGKPSRRPTTHAPRRKW